MRVLVLLLTSVLHAVSCEAWFTETRSSTSRLRAATVAVQTPCAIHRSMAPSASATRLRLAARDNASDNEANCYSSVLYRADFAGVSVSTSGFWVLLRVGSSAAVNTQKGESLFWPVRVTANPLDATAATSPEALTLLQLLAGVDMAGAILPPDTLARILMGVCDDAVTTTESDDVKAKKARQIRTDIRETGDWPDQASKETSYLDLHDWFQSRVRLPVTTLDQIQCQIEPSNTANDDERTPTATCQWDYQSQVKDFGSFSMTPTSVVLDKIAWRDPAQGSKAATDVGAAAEASFFALALALRYQCPVLLSVDAPPSTNDSNINSYNNIFWTRAQIEQAFPLYRSRDKLQEMSQTVAVNIERGFEIHKLQAALRIALERQDMGAAAKIRDRLDEMDSLADLPVQPETDTKNMQ